MQVHEKAEGDESLTFTLNRSEAALLAQLLSRTTGADVGRALEAARFQYGFDVAAANPESGVFRLYWSADDTAEGNPPVDENSPALQIGQILATNMSEREAAITVEEAEQIIAKAV